MIEDLTKDANVTKEKNKRSPLRRYVTLFVCVFVLASSVEAMAACNDFENASGTWLFGDVITTPNIEVHMSKLQLSDGTWWAYGDAMIVSSNNAGGTSIQELSLENIVARVYPNNPATHVEFLYSDKGGNVNLGINGDFRNVNDPADLNGLIIGGCEVFVTGIPIFGGDSQGTVEITPLVGTTINVFGVGGQEFYIDDICIDF